MNYKWHEVRNLESKKFTCGYCGSNMASEKGYFTGDQSYGGARGRIYICHHCERPTFFANGGEQYPGSSFGESVDGVSDPVVLSLYEEARRCIGASAFTSCVLACRKLLMHIAVSKGAEENKPFIFYVEYLSTSGFVPPGARDWIDHIRKKGNEATHEIVEMKRDDAEELVSFAGMLLKIMFEFPAKVLKKYGKQS